MVDILVGFSGSSDDIRKVLSADLPIKVSDENVGIEGDDIQIDVSVKQIQKAEVDAFVQAIVDLFPEKNMIGLAQYDFEKAELFKYVYQNRELSTYKCIGVKKSTGEHVFERV